MPYPPARPIVPIAAEMSPIRAPFVAAAMPAASARSVVSIRAVTSGDWVPIWNVSAESATHPCSCAAKSMDSTSPSASTWSDGSPCSAASLTEVHRTPGYGIAPNDGW